MYFTLRSIFLERSTWGVNHLQCIFVELFPKEITKIGEQIFSFYSPTWSHFCYFTFHDVADHLPFFQHKNKLIKYPEENVPLCAKMSASYLQCLSLSNDPRKFYLGPSFLALVHHPNLRVSGSPGFHIRASQRSFTKKTNEVKLMTVLFSSDI